MTFKGEYKLAGLPWLSLFQVNSLAWLCSYMSTSHCARLHRVRDGVAVQHFTFVLTDLEGCQRFGFCRLTNSTRTCLCILRYICVRVCEYDIDNNNSHAMLRSNTMMKTRFQLSSMVWSVLQTSQQLGWLPHKRTGEVIVSAPLLASDLHTFLWISLTWWPQSSQQNNETKALLSALYKQPLPLAAGSVTLQMVNL